MGVKLGINGFGRIGRCTLRAILQRGLDIEIVAINDLTDTKTLAHLLKYDSVHGVAKFDVEAAADGIIINGKKVKICAEKDPAQLPWKELGVEVVLESTGRFTKRELAQKHIDAGAKKVIISAPGEEVDLTLVLGVNDSQYDKTKHHVISNASCTTNCLAPVAKVLNDTFGLKKGIMTTVHAYTNDQNVLDLPHKDLRRARACAVSMIPTSTGAAKAVGLVLPELKGRLTGFSVRVPTPNVSLVDLTAELERNATKEEINAAMKAAAEGPMKGILRYTDEPLVSIDLNGEPASSTLDSQLTMVLEGNMAKIISWYDNEWGYSNRCAELITKVL
ncbi:type I glyceraldehyde-3-phosphate dehydrogenase [Seleniivibrio woodruffii]|uniref:Glyceraldehyde-3-phosphate dehydrogenase n=1 Tax=Seleniivibrio woodruffii TaxID=1078050 RepID=A0A4R1KBH4_9BACT|nr:type I glyceraldehyde-3-phosphate dehydrogenase [Seleniivibrio woodruffii]TCK61846.1 glyceraldehyde 3-phosphate dehydrogenase [Seleniivibrio woodruffii]TVZ35039.1 glyceraldehyde 3-phosphate dehydrogenase [Seleniivibrio woodruffii]